MKKLGRRILNFALIFGGIFSAAFGLKGFLLSSRFNQLQRGVTVYKSGGGVGSTGRTGEEREILDCVVTRTEISRIKNAVTEIDPSAFLPCMLCQMFTAGW